MQYALQKRSWPTLRKQKKEINVDLYPTKPHYVWKRATINHGLIGVNYLGIHLRALQIKRTFHT